MAAKKSRNAGRPARDSGARASGERRPPAGGDTAGNNRAPDVADHIAGLAIAALALASLVSLWRIASGSVFATDECFHAHLAGWIASHGKLPREIPELYSGMPYFYPPLFHLVGAAQVAIAGAGSLKYLNVLLTALLYALLLLVPTASVPPAARRWAVAILVANASLALYSVRFYAEALMTLLAVAVVVLILGLRQRPRVAGALTLGAAAGLALMAKQPAVLFPALFGLLAAVYLACGERRLAGLFALALGVSIAVSLPFFVRNTVLFGSPFYPPVTSEAGHVLDQLGTRMFSRPPISFYRGALEGAGPVIPWLTTTALVVGAIRGPRDLGLGLLALCTTFIAVAPLIPRFEVRHLNPCFAVMALLGCATLAGWLGRRRLLGLGVAALLLVWGSVAVMGRVDYRRSLNPPRENVEAYRAVAERVPAGTTVLSLWTYDTFYYSGRGATWPIPWSRSAEQLPLFTTRDPEAFLATLDAQGVGTLLVPRTQAPPAFNGGNYPAGFIECLISLIESRRLEIVWQSRAWAIVRRVR